MFMTTGHLYTALGWLWNKLFIQGAQHVISRKCTDILITGLNLMTGFEVFMDITTYFSLIEIIETFLALRIAMYSNKIRY